MVLMEGVLLSSAVDKIERDAASLLILRLLRVGKGLLMLRIVG
jgi:hypothetical protein